MRFGILLVIVDSLDLVSLSTKLRLLNPFANLKSHMYHIVLCDVNIVTGNFETVVLFDLM